MEQFVSRVQGCVITTAIPTGDQVSLALLILTKSKLST